MDTITLLLNGLNPHNLQVVTDEASPVISLKSRFDDATEIRQVAIVVKGPEDEEMWRHNEPHFKTPHFYYGGKPLAPKTRYTVVASVVDSRKEKCEITACFETGFLGTPWAAKWIEPEQNNAQKEKEIRFHEIFLPDTDDGQVTSRLQPCPQLMKSFECKEQPVCARVYASAHGIYELCLNGKRVGANRFAPETSSYATRLYYQTYDVADLLQNGENQLVATLADGWWAGRIGLSGDSCQFGDRLGLIMQLEMVFADGSTQMVVSDDTFVSRRSNIDYADLFVGERHDYTKPESPIEPVSVIKCPMENLIAQPIAPVTVLEKLTEHCFVDAPNGELVADFGQVVAGVAELTVKCAAGTQVTLDFSETLDENGNFFCNIIGRNKDQRDVFVCGGDVTVFSPRFTYHGFRYVRVGGVKREQIEKLQVLVMGTQLEPSGRFCCSDERLNRLQQNIVWSEKSNMFSVPTDCPQREKMGWTGDIQVFAKTGCFNYDLNNFLSGWLANVREEQLPDGEVPNIVPCYPVQDKMQRENSGNNTSPAWGDACVLVPYELYRFYGDARVLRDNLKMMERWLHYIKQIAARQPENFAELNPAQQRRNPYLWTKGHQFGDWLIPSLRDKQPDGVQAGVEATYRVVGSCFYAITLQTYIGVLKALSVTATTQEKREMQEKKTKTEALLDKVRQAVEEEYVKPNGHIDGDLQGLYVIALRAEIGDEVLRRRMAEQLVKLLQENDYRLDTGFVTVPYLLDVLTESGCSDVAAKVLFQTRSPSWLYQVERGATTIWENWEAIRPDGTVTGSSFNHYALGCVGDWLYRNVGGIEPYGPGFTKVRFAPDFSLPLTNAAAEYESLYGVVHSSWRKLDGVISYQVHIPGHTSGTVVLPAKEYTLEAENKSAVISTLYHESKTYIDISPGKYTFAFFENMLQGQV